MGKVFDAVVVILYPLIVLGGLTYLSVRWTALLLLMLLGRRVVALVLTTKATSVPVIIQVTTTAAIIGAAAATGSEIYLRFTPFLISLVFIAQFVASLRKGSTPIIERFARLKKPDLPPDHVSYCRTLTKVWLIVFVGNSTLVLSAAFVEAKVLWALMVGPISYFYLGSFITIEFLFRKRRFQEFDPSSLLDRLLKPLLGRGDAR
jgi:uncharacterized membrane protein